MVIWARGVLGINKLCRGETSSLLFLSAVGIFVMSLGDAAQGRDTSICRELPSAGSLVCMEEALICPGRIICYFPRAASII